jgi:hypothetical protein
MGYIPKPLCELAKGHLENEDIAAFFPLDLSGDVVVLRACIDASTRDSGLFTVAGVAYGYDRAVKANSEWKSALGNRQFHMTDLNAREGDFKGISDDEVDEIMRATVGIVRKYASYSVAVSCDLDQVAEFLPVTSSPDPDSREILAAFRSAYGVMCHVCMHYLGGRANQYGKAGRQIMYTLEMGDSGQKGLRRYIEFFENKPEWDKNTYLNDYSLHSMQVTRKSEIPGALHATDLIAWEWSKHIERHKAGKPIRASLSAMVGANNAPTPDKHGLTLSDGNKFFFRYYNPDRLQGTVKFFQAMLDATTDKELKEAFVRWEATR